MKKTFLLLFATFVCTGVHIFASALSYGQLNYGKETVQTIEGSGAIKLDSTTVTKVVQVNGSLEANYAEIKQMQVNGQVKLNKCIVEEKSFIAGLLIATQTRFLEEIRVASDETTFDSCSIKSLRIMKSSDPSKKQMVYLKGQTKVSDSIIFESGNGLVKLDPESEMKVKIKGGKILE